MIPPIHRLLTSDLGDYPRSETLAKFLESNGSRGFRRFDRILRNPKSYKGTGLCPPTSHQLSHYADSEISVATWCCLSMQRNGFVRERALRALSNCTERVAFAAILNRTIDPVPPIATLALRLFEWRLSSEAPGSIVWVLPLLDYVCRTPRAQRSNLAERIEVHLESQRDEMDRELKKAFAEPDSHVRQSAVQHYCTLFAGSPSALPMLSSALEDAHPSIRLWAGRRILAETDSSSRADVIQRLAGDSNPTLRLIALREYRNAKAVEKLKSFCFDPHAGIRIYARRYLKKLDQNLDYRRRALNIIQIVGSSTGELLGALAVLSEFGQRTDIGAIETYLNHPRARVAAEARRTLTLIRA